VLDVAALRRDLNALLTAFDAKAHLANDPVSLVRPFRRRADREVAAFLAAAITYGRVAMIRRNVTGLLSRLGRSPAEFVRTARRSRIERALRTFSHRFHKGPHLAVLAAFVGDILRTHGSLQAFARRAKKATLPGGDGEKALRLFAESFRDFAALEIASGGTKAKRAELSFLVPSPAHGSACKRPCMFLRWVAREDDGVDLGLWSYPDPSQLIVPLDTHVARVARALGFTRRRSDTFATALEVTQALQRIHPADPLRYDFALCHLGIELPGRIGARIQNQSGRQVSRSLTGLALEANRRAFVRIHP